MILLWFILGITLIFAIARYNESNKLFWTLLVAFTMGFAGTKVVLDTYHGDEKSNDYLTQVYSTQESVVTTMTTMSFENVTDATPVKVTALNLVGQSFTPAQSETNITLGKVFERTRDQPQLTFIKPPELCLQKDFSTLHDTG